MLIPSQELIAILTLMKLPVTRLVSWSRSWVYTGHNLNTVQQSKSLVAGVEMANDLGTSLNLKCGIGKEGGGLSQSSSPSVFSQLN